MSLVTRARDAVAARIALALVIALPAVVLRLAGVHPPPVPSMIVFGAGVLAAAVLLLWASETARLDMSGALALALLALIAVLPEYAVDLYYAYTAGSRPEYTAYAAANMTGANRLLVGVGWTLVALVFALAVRRMREAGRHRRVGVIQPPSPRRDVRLGAHHRIELGFLAIAALIAFIPALTGEIGWYVSVLLIVAFVAYLARIGRSGAEDVQNLVGVPARLAELPRLRRRQVTWLGFALGALTVFCSAEPFAESLVDAGTVLGVDRFLLVQWLAPLTSEAPELIVACVFAWRLRDGDAMGVLLSSKVNQWTLLIGSLPLAYRAGGGAWSLPLDARQIEEVLLTAAQTVLGLAMLVGLYFRRVEAVLLFVLFAVQFALPGTQIRLVLSGVYLAIGFSLLIARNRDLGHCLRAAVPSLDRLRSPIR
ncbi:MAG: sodium:proton exchanger [Actinomadura rubrobrunea]|nr:sodium:proton exchanger [Actinomadura rubrobrunea]